MAVPNTFATDTGSIPLADLDANFSYYDGAFNIASNIFTFADTVNFQDAADPTKIGAFSFAGITTATTRTYTFPNLTGTLATLGNLTQSFAGATTIANAFTVTGTSTSTSIQSTQSTGTITIGGTAGTGAITVGQSNGVQTLNLGTGATTNGTTKTINIGTAGVSGSITNINIGSAVSGALGTATINSPTATFAGNVGIGTSSPSSKLHLSGAATADARITLTQTTAGLTGTLQQGATGIALAAAGSQALLFETNGVERMRIDSSGNVGIGAASSGARIYSTAAACYTQSVSSTGTNYVFFQQQNTGGNLNVGIETSTGGSFAGGTSAYSGVIAHSGAYPLSFATNNTERMRIDSSGNVGIGTTSPASNSVTIASKTVAMTTGYGMSWNSGATQLAGYDTNILQFITASTERMRIDSSGNVLVTSAAGLGYGTGAGGTVTQATSRTTGVTLSKPTGAITMFSAAGSATAATFTVTNTLVAATDTIILNQKSGTNLYVLLVTAVAAGSFNITFYTTGGVATDAPVINFSLIKGVTA